MYQYETSLLEEGYQFIAGCDEVGRGPLAGPVVASAVILDPNHTINGLNDSKQLSETKREQLASEIIEHAIAYHISYVFPEEIDRINIYEASRKAMLDAIEHLHVKADYVLSDAMPLPTLNVPYQSIIKGDTKSASIAAASILAKVSRDRYMVEMAHTYPGYGFERHKGYPTKQHLTALQELGITPIHRTTYAPVRKILEEQLKLDI